MTVTTDTYRIHVMEWAAIAPIDVPLTVHESAGSGCSPGVTTR